jgi:hypothetical protein
MSSHVIGLKSLHVLPAAHALGADKPIGFWARTIRDGFGALQFISAKVQTAQTRVIVPFVPDELVGASATRSFQNQAAIGVHRTTLEKRQFFFDGGIDVGAGFVIRSEDVAVTPAPKNRRATGDEPEDAFCRSELDDKQRRSLGHWVTA